MSEEKQAEKRPNVLLICVDQWPCSLVGCYGNDRILTPTLDNFARNGIRFANCYSTCPICIPARRSLMTGLYPKSHGDRVYSDTMEMPKVPTMAQCFREAGYQAYAVGKMHVYPQRNRIGFDDVLLHEEGRSEFGVVDDYAQYLASRGHVGEEFVHGMSPNEYFARPWPLAEEEHPTNWTTREMCRTIKRRDPTRPFFFYVSYTCPHPPLVPVKEFLEMYDGIDIPDPVVGDWLDDSTIIRYLCEKDGVEYAPEYVRRARKAFYALCTQIDFSVRLLVGTLREEGLLDNTLIGFVSDHGDSLFEHDMTAKRNFYENSTHVPFILTGPLLDDVRGTVRSDIVSLEDVMPTLLDFCGIGIPETVEGDALLSPEYRQKEHLFCEVNEGVRSARMVRSGNLKLIYYPCGNVFHLFDLEEDPKEMHNVHGDVRYRREEEAMVAALVENLHGVEDRSWIRDGKLVGFPEPPYLSKRNYGQGNQRGLQFPPAPKRK